MTLTMLVATILSLHSVTLTWTNNGVYDNVLVYRATQSGGPYSLLATIGGTEIVYVDTDVSPGITYYYAVSGIFNGLESDKSNEVSASILIKTRIGGDQ